MNKEVQTPTYKDFQESVAMTVTLISFGMMFATLFLGYTLVRFNSPTWPPVEIQGLPKLLPFLSTLVMLLSSLSYYFMEKNSRLNLPRAKMLWVLTLVLGFVFLGLQWTLWATLGRMGIVVANGMVPSMVYAFTWFHAAHIILGLLALFYVGHFLFRGTVTHPQVVNVGKFWHFLGVVWIIMYLTLFVI